MKLYILAGPSCVGKSPLYKAMKRFYPDLAASLQPVVLYNSRAPRPGEIGGQDYHFRRREEIENLRKKYNFVVLDVRGDLQALDLEELGTLLTNGNAFFEGNPFVGNILQTSPKLDRFQRLGFFMSPLSHEEIMFLRSREEVDLPELVTEIMRRKLLRRMEKQKGTLSQNDLDEVERRAGSAFKELTMAPNFDWVIPNHDGEDSENWSAFYYPLGNARRCLRTVVSLLNGDEAELCEHWDADLFA